MIPSDFTRDPETGRRFSYVMLPYGTGSESVKVFGRIGGQQIVVCGCRTEDLAKMVVDVLESRADQEEKPFIGTGHGGRGDSSFPC